MSTEFQVCPRCGEQCSSNDSECPNCLHPFDGPPPFLWRLLGTLLAMLMVGALGSIAFAFVFGVIGLLLWLASGERGVLWICLGFGALLGFLLGVGICVAARLQHYLQGRQPIDEKGETPAARAPVLARMMFAALAMTVIGSIFVLVTHTMIAPQPPQGLLLWQAAVIFIPIFAVIGCLLGAAIRHW